MFLLVNLAVVGWESVMFNRDIPLSNAFREPDSIRENTTCYDSKTFTLQS